MARVLVVDDDRSIRELARINLERDGFEVLEASQGEEALAMFESAKVRRPVESLRVLVKECLRRVSGLGEAHDLPNRALGR